MMPPSPIKRKRREDMRRQALTLAQKGLRSETKLRVEEGGGFRAVNKRGGPVDHGTPDAQKRAAEPMQHAKREERNDQARRSFTLHRNASGNERQGLFYRTIARSGGEVHDYGGGKRVFVRKPESGGTGNHPPHIQIRSSTPRGDDSGVRRYTDPKRTTDNVLKPVEQAHKPASSTYDRMARDLAKRRATENKPKARRKLARLARYSPDSGRHRRIIGLGVSSSGKRQYI